MPQPIISVRNLGKKYRLGVASKHDTLRDRISHGVKGLLSSFQKPNPESGIRNPESKGATSNLKLETLNSGASADEFWALREVSFDIQQGEVVGIIGRNGAGKSTLLKILSQITEPTTGEIRMRGRVASLLEVGTGFHQELSGRENIFLNGAILGMSQAEIRKKFDEIIDFSGVEKFLDTPVKRYSSGMYVRLAFAIAAHLEPEILIVDEVLAVGDAEFQRKCLGKMKDVASQGRTVLFVSHTMVAVNSLCQKAILLRSGRIASIGPTNAVINEYISDGASSMLRQHWESPETAPGGESVRIRSIELLPDYSRSEGKIDVRTPLCVRFAFWNLGGPASINLSMNLHAVTGECIFAAATAPEMTDTGLWQAECQIPGNFLNDGSYAISMLIVKDGGTILHHLEDGITFEVAENRPGSAWHGKWPGAVRPQLEFTLTPAAA